MLNSLGVLLLAATTATGGVGGKAHVGGKRFLRGDATMYGPPPAGGPISPGNGMGCSFGHPGCSGGQDCPGGAGMPGGAGGQGGPGGMGGPGGRRFANTRSQVYFVDPPGMKIGWQTVAGGVERVYMPGQLTVPARYNFTQGFIYRLKLTDIPGRPGLQLYPTIEVAPSAPATDAYLTHNPIPAQFTEEDFDQVVAGNFVTKVIYLPDPKFQELAIAGVGVETLVSTRLEPGVDPVLEADRRGTILMILRVGAIDLEMPAAGAMVPAAGAAGAATTVIPGSAPGTVLPPNSLPPGVSPVAPRVAPPTPPAPSPTVDVDTAPVSPAPGDVTPRPADPAAPPAADPAAPPADPAADPAVEMPKP